MTKLRLSIALLVLLCLAAPVHALNQPAVNLGFTNFIDGASPGPGWYWTEYLQIIHADPIKNDDGHDLISDANLSAFVNLNQFIYESNVNFLGGRLGIDVIIPLVDLDVDFPLNSEDGVGDILVGPYIQWGPHMIFDRPYFHRFESIL